MSKTNKNKTKPEPMQDKITFDLSTPIKVQLSIGGKNDFVDLDKLYLLAPTYRQKEYTIDLKKRFISAMVRLANSTKPKSEPSSQGDDKPLDGKAFIQVLYSAGDDFDLIGFFKQFENLFCAGVCFKDEAMQSKIHAIELQKLSEEDFNSLVGKYLEVFMSASLMSILK